MSYDEARRRNALPVPADQYGGSLGGTYDYWDELALDPPTGAVYAEISLLYQPTSWEYVQFLYLANRRENPFLADEGVNLLDAWLATGMAEPYVMASATWGDPGSGGGGGGGDQCNAPGAPTNLAASPGKKSVSLDWSAASPAPATGGYNVYFDQSGKLQLRGSVSAATLSFKDTGLTSRMSYTYLVTAWNDCNGNGSFDFGTDLEGPASDPATATAR
jgi:hypothetical protein